jgi:type IV secretory pathway VirB4 component
LKNGSRNPFFNKKHSDETIDKIIESSNNSEKRKKYYEKIKSTEHRKFLSEFFYSFIYKYSAGIPEEELQNINKIVDKILTDKCNKFSDAIKFFNTEETKKIYEILKFWEEPVLTQIFEHEREINWSDRIMGFDLTEYGDKDFIIVPILYYILYKIEDIIN